MILIKICIDVDIYLFSINKINLNLCKCIEKGVCQMKA